MASGQFRYELSDVEKSERGERLAVVLGRIEVKKEELKAAAGEIKGTLKALAKEAYVLALAIREGYEMRDIAEQQVMELMVAECSLCMHQSRFEAGTDLSQKLCDNCRVTGSMEEKK